METLDNPNNLPYNDPLQTRKVAFVTGASAGIGWYTTLHLYMHGWDVYLGVRNLDKGRKAMDDIVAEAQRRREANIVRSDVATGHLELVAIDLLDISSVDRAALELKSKEDHLDLLVHNAGIMAVPRETSKDGFEVQLQTNYVAPFVLTDRLLALVKAASQPRIIYVSSIGHRFALKRASLGKRQDGFPSMYYGFVRYGYSKTAGMQMLNQVARDHPDVLCLSVHPGFVMETDLYRHWNDLAVVGPCFNLGFRGFGSVFGVKKEEGSYSTLVAALSPSLSAKNDSGGFVWTKGSKGTPSKLVTDEKYARDNWNWTINEMERASIPLSLFERK